MRTLQPEGWPRPSGFSNGIEAGGRLVFVAGQVGWDENLAFQSDDLVDQVRQALKNILSVLNEADAGPEHIARMTWYIVDKHEYLARTREIGEVYRKLMGKHFKTMTLVQVEDLIEDKDKIKIEITAVI